MCIDGRGWAEGSLGSLVGGNGVLVFRFGNLDLLIVFLRVRESFLLEKNIIQGKIKVLYVFCYSVFSDVFVGIF